MNEHETIASNQADELLASLASHKFIQLTTFRKNGDAVATPVWFVAENGKLYVTTNGNAGKLKRIRSTGRVLLAPCDPRGKALGEQVEVRVRDVPQDQHGDVHTLLARKYGFPYRVFAVIHIFIGWKRKAKRTYIEIEPKSE